MVVIAGNVSRNESDTRISRFTHYGFKFSNRIYLLIQITMLPRTAQPDIGDKRDTTRLYTALYLRLYTIEFIEYTDGTPKNGTHHHTPRVDLDGTEAK